MSLYKSTIVGTGENGRHGIVVLWDDNNPDAVITRAEISDLLPATIDKALEDLGFRIVGRDDAPALSPGERIVAHADTYFAFYHPDTCQWHNSPWRNGGSVGRRQLWKVQIVKYFHVSDGKAYGALIDFAGYRVHAIQTREGLTLECADGGPEGQTTHMFLRGLETAGVAEFVFDKGEYAGLSGNTYWRGEPIPGLQYLVPRP